MAKSQGGQAVTCPICNQKIDPSDHSEKWGPEFAHSRCVIAFTAGSAIQDAKLQDRIKRLEEFARTIENDFDHDEDAHRYGTMCRVCDAAELLRETKIKEAKP
jgi:hypothetical protein